MIKVNTKKDERIAQTFPNDPYSNLCILTTTQKLNLQQAFLSMDSEYFSQIDPDTRQIDLRQLKEQPLIRVIHSLYGQQLILSSVSQLVEIYPIILYLGIEDYKKNIMQEIKDRKQIFQNLQFLQLSYKYKFCFQTVLEIHMQNKLKLLEDSKNYLQLSKIQNETFDFLLSQFLSRYGEGQCKILNNVMQNYFNRNNIKPLAYLKHSTLSKLLSIWLKYHHVSPSEMITLKSMPLISIEEEGRSRKKTELQRRSTQEDPQSKRKKILQLENQVKFKDRMIRELIVQIQQLKKQLNIKDHQELTVKSMLITGGTQEAINPFTTMKKKKRLAQMSPEIQSDSETEKNQPANNERRKMSMEFKDVKGMMHRLGIKNSRKI